ncbi:MAG: hypothetical protein J3Q66DRAFT_141436 [Benniella sp.]|nr:MAG: hypothetical protein J3Q66DRAFT_141436 [Benniella sp.]
MSERIMYLVKGWRTAFFFFASGRNREREREVQCMCVQNCQSSQGRSRKVENGNIGGKKKKREMVPREKREKGSRPRKRLLGEEEMKDRFAAVKQIRFVPFLGPFHALLSGGEKVPMFVLRPLFSDGAVPCSPPFFPFSSSWVSSLSPWLFFFFLALSIHFFSLRVSNVHASFFFSLLPCLCL